MGNAWVGLGRGGLWCWLAGEEDILIPVVLSRELGEAVPGSVWRTTRGGHGCLVSWLLVFLERCRCLEVTNDLAVGVPG